MDCSNAQSVLPTLPGELWDHIVDSLSLSSAGYCADDEDTTIDALRTLLHVSRSLRLRALFNLLRSLDMSPAHGRAHLAKAAELLTMLSDESGLSLRAMPREISLDLDDNILTGWMDALPKLDALRTLTLCNGALSGAGDAITVESLILDECVFDTAFIARFPHLRRLELINCRAIGSDSDEPLPFLPGQCELFLHSPCEDVLDWVAQNADSFVLRSVALTSSSAPSVPMDAVHTLHIGLQDLDAECAAVAKCTSLRRLEVVAPSLPRAVLLFKAVRVVAPSCAAVVLNLPDESILDGDVAELSAALAKWKCVREVWVNDAEYHVEDVPPARPNADGEKDAAEAAKIAVVEHDEDDALKPTEPANPYAPPFALGVSTEHAIVVEADDDEPAPAPAPNPNPYAPPFALGVSSMPASHHADDEDDDEDDEAPRAANPYAPPFALGVSTAPSEAGSEDDDEYDGTTTPSLTSDSELSETDDDDEDNAQEVTITFSRDAFKPPFTLGVSRARIADDDSDGDDAALELELNMPTPRVDAYKPPFELGTSTDRSLDVESE